VTGFNTHACPSLGTCEDLSGPELRCSVLCATLPHPSVSVSGELSTYRSFYLTHSQIASKHGLPEGLIHSLQGKHEKTKCLERLGSKLAHLTGHMAHGKPVEERQDNAVEQKREARPTRGRVRSVPTQVVEHRLVDCPEAITGPIRASPAVQADESG
jgi:hypothetical protein